MHRQVRRLPVPCIKPGFWQIYLRKHYNLLSHAGVRCLAFEQPKVLLSLFPYLAIERSNRVNR